MKKIKLIHNTKYILQLIIIIFLLSILILIVYSKFILKQRIIRVGDYSIFVVLTGSMSPTISPGEMILIKQKEQYNQGDIVTYLDEDNYFITHRIIQIDDSTCVTKGDNNNVQDLPFTNDNILGSVVYHSKVLGFFILYILKPLIIIYIAILLLFIFKEDFFLVQKTKPNKEIQIEKK